MSKTNGQPRRQYFGRKFIDDKIMLALSCGATNEVAAQQAGVTINTVRRRLNDPEFLAQLRLLRDNMVRRTAAMLTAAAGEAVRTLLDLQSPKHPSMVRLGAARAIIELGIRTREHVEFTERLASLEGQVIVAVNGTTAMPDALLPTIVEAVPNATLDRVANAVEPDATGANVGETGDESANRSPS